MTRYAIDPPVLLALARASSPTLERHQLVAPSTLRSQAMSLLYAAVRAGETSEGDARRVLERITEIKVRLLGDRVSRATAWRLAAELDLDDTRYAEYLAIARLQADAIIALDPDLLRLADGVVPIAPLSDLLP